MASFHQRFLIVILMAGVIFTEPEVSVDADADSELSEKCLSETSP